ncbi:MAG: hypothetical protein HY903_10650 [Deltaproteobacteria bacterium]|nr:hypothetical protein [Deltaproteobacteria bacterium]
MNIGFGMNPAAFARVGGAPSQAQLNQQVAMTGASSASQAQQDRMEKTQRQTSAKLVGNAVATKKVLDKAGVTKPGGVKKGG